MDFFQFAFIQRAMVVGGLMAMLSAILGVLVILRRMSFFSDAISHASFTGIALGLLIGISPTWGAILFSVAIGLLIIWLAQRKILNVDAIIGVLFSGSLALGVLIISRLSGYRLNLVNFLFGDILAVSSIDLVLSLLLFVAVLTITILFFRHLLFISFSKELAKVNGLSVEFWDYLFAILLSLTIALSLKIVGAVLVSALIVIPATAAKLVSKTVRGMVFWSVFFALSSIFIGLASSYIFDLPSGPSIVIIQVLLFVLALIFK